MWVVVTTGDDEPLTVVGPFADNIAALVYATQMKQEDVDICEVTPPEHVENN